MKTNPSLSILLGSLWLLAVGVTSVRAIDAPSPSQDVSSLVNYADQLHKQGVKGPDLVAKVDKRADEIAEKTGQPSLHGIGDFVLQQHAKGLHGPALSTAIHDEVLRRNVDKGKGKPGGPPSAGESDKGSGSAADSNRSNDHGGPADGRKKGGK